MVKCAEAITELVSEISEWRQAYICFVNTNALNSESLFLSCIAKVNSSASLICIYVVAYVNKFQVGKTFQINITLVFQPDATADMDNLKRDLK